LIVTALYTGMRTSELLGLTWQDVDLAGGVLHVRAQLGRAHRGKPARRVALKTPAAIRDIPLVPQLARELREHRDASPDRSAAGWVFATAKGTPLGHRNAQSRALGHAARLAGLEDSEWPPLRFHDLRHTFASHLIIDLALDVAQVSRILGMPRSRRRSTSTPTCSTTHGTPATSAGGWPRARSPGYWSPNRTAATS
jgi:integrase